ncbi:MAG: carotenoid biosynthesis protein [Desulfuromonadales bacterium]|nr:carotenoid biosynthesis protein [Desulfuromonadales bacterium]
MQEVINIAIGTFAMRPYVFAFFAAYLIAGVFHLGWRAIFLFTVIGYLISFASEFSSIHTGFPYGWYYYINATQGRELWIAGVPFFDSLSYVFLCYCSYSTAIFILSPLKRSGFNLIPLETISIRKSFAALVVGSLLQVYLDIVTDPVALQGNRWFLGQIYGYNTPGIHFGVPVSNYLGWWLVSAVMIFALQRLAIRLPKNGNRPAGVTTFPLSQLLGVVLYLSVIAFNLTVALLIGEMTIAISSFFIVFLPFVLVFILALRRINNYKKEELGDHVRDFPWSPASISKK